MFEDLVERERVSLESLVEDAKKALFVHQGQEQHLLDRLFRLQKKLRGLDAYMKACSEVDSLQHVEEDED